MKKNHLFILLVFGILARNEMTAQTDESTTDRHLMLGVNATSFVKTFLSLNDVNTTGTSPYQFTVRYITTSNFAIRGSIGIALANFENIEEDDNFISSNSAYDFGLGFEKRSLIAKRWMIFGGVDLFAGTERFFSETSSSNLPSVSNEELTTTMGIAPLFGIQFNINDRISISTETQMRIFSSKTKDTFTNSGNSSVNSTEETNRMSVQPLLPGFLHFNVLF